MSLNERAGAVPPPSQGGAKKLRFDDVVTTSSATSDVGAGGGSLSGRGAFRASPTISSPPLFASSLRRPSEAASSHNDVHVQLNPTPEVIRHDGSVMTKAEVASDEAHHLPAVEEPAGEVANFLADVGAGLNSGFSSSSISVPSVPAMTGISPNGSAAVVGTACSISESGTRATTPDASERFRTLLLQLSALILEHRPKDPEQYIVDHLNARLLSASAIHRTPSHEAGEGGDRAAAAAGGCEVEMPLSLPAVELTAVFQPTGETVVERLASNALSTEVGHSVLTRIAEQLISAQPDDPEDFLWARLEARSFGEEAAHNVTVNADGFPVVRPEDPAQLALLKDIPASSPGYVVAVNLLPVLFAKKPADPISYLFYHIGSRARSSAAPSVHSSSRHQRVNGDGDDEFEADSCTSREFGEDSYSGPEDVADAGSVSESANQLPLQRKGSLGSLFDAAAAASTHVAAQSLRRSGGDRSTGSRHRTSTHGLTSSRASSGRRSAVPAPGPSRASKDANPPSVPDELSALYGSGAKRVSIAQQEVQPPSPSHFSYDSSALPSNNFTASTAPGAARSTRDSASTVEPHAYGGLPLPAAALGHGSGNTLWKVEMDEHARIRQEFELLRMREELRLERLQHEVRSLARECEYRTRMAVLNRTDRMADRAAAAAREALEEAHIYRGFLCAQLDQLEGEQQRQIRVVSQQLARMQPSVPTAAPAMPSAALSSWLGEDAASRQMDAREPNASASSRGIPSELDILKKQVELLTMEQARANFCGYASASQGRFRQGAGPTPQASSRSPYPMQ